MQIDGTKIQLDKNYLVKFTNVLTEDEIEARAECDWIWRDEHTYIMTGSGIAMFDAQHIKAIRELD